MSCKINTSTSLPIIHKLPSKGPGPRFGSKLRVMVSSSNSGQSRQAPATVTAQTPLQSSALLNVKFQTLEACKLGISRYPDFEYNARGGIGMATGCKEDPDAGNKIQVSFDAATLYIPPMQSSTTRFLGLPLPPFLKIEIVPEIFQGTINKASGKVDLEFRAKFLFSVGSIYRAPPLLVQTTLTSEESKGKVKSGRGEKMDAQGRCRLVGVAIVDPINDVLMDSFLGLPTECIADLNAMISISDSS